METLAVLVADHERVGDLGSVQPASDQGQHLRLARRQAEFHLELRRAIRSSAVQRQRSSGARSARSDQLADRNTAREAAPRRRGASRSGALASVWDAWR